MMTRPVRYGALMLLVGLCASPALAQCEALEAKVQLLTRQIEAMQQQIETLQALQKLDGGKTAPAAAAAPQPSQAQQQQARAAAMELYDRIDQLLGGGQIDEAKRVLAEFNATNQGTPAASFTSSLTREMAAVGKPAPEDWSIESWFQGESDIDLDGEAATLVVFWESWCPHCRNEVPKVQAIYDEYRAKGLQVIGVTRLTRDATAEAVASIIAENEVSYPMAKESGALAEYFVVQGIPAAAVVKNGVIVWRGHPARLSSTLLESLM